MVFVNRLQTVGLRCNYPRRNIESAALAPKFNPLLAVSIPWLYSSLRTIGVIEGHPLTTPVTSTQGIAPNPLIFVLTTPRLSSGIIIYFLALNHLLKVPKPDGLMDFPTAGGTAAAAAAEAAGAVATSGAGRGGGRNPAAKLASITGALRRHGRNAGLGGGGEDEAGGAATFCKEPATPHAWLCSRQPRTPLGFLPRFSRSGSTVSGGSSGGGSSGAGSGGGGRGKGKDGADEMSLRRHFTTVGGLEATAMVTATAAAASTEGSKGRVGAAHKAGRNGGGSGSGGGSTRRASGMSAGSAHDSPSATRDGGPFATGSGSRTSGRGGKKMSIFSGFGPSKGGSKARYEQQHESGEQAATAAAAVAAEAAEEDESARAVPLQLEDEGLLQVGGWVGGNKWKV